MRKLFYFFNTLGRKILKDDCMGLAAEMAFQLMLAFFPTLIFVISVFGLVGQQEQLYPQIVNFLYRVVPYTTADFLTGLIGNLFDESSGNIALISFLVAVWTSSNGAYIVIKALNRIFDTPGEQGFLVRRLFAVGAILLFGALLVVGSNVMVFWNAVFLQVQQMLPEMVSRSMFINWSEWLAFTIIVTIFAAFVYSYVPEKKPVSIQKAVPGALLFVGFWLLVSQLFGIYIDHIAVGRKVYGALGAIMFFMLWLYLTSLAFLAGAEAVTVYLEDDRPSGDSGNSS